MDALVRDLTADAGSVNASIMSAVTKLASLEVRDEVVDRLLRETPTSALYPVVQVLGDRGRDGSASAGSVGAIESAVARLTADSQADWRSLSIATRALIARQPTERLFPAVRRLLSAADRGAVLGGIDYANSLGRTELIPDLIAKLDSMDSEIRTKSREAIDAILELEQLRKDARDSVRGAGDGD